ncbi:hypothetical protein C5F48_24370, partial [Cereibacter changlensis JA139]
GAIAVNRGAARVEAAVIGSTGSHKAQGTGIAVSALNLASIYSGVGSAAIAVSASGGTGIAASVAVALANNKLRAETEARIAGFTTAGALSAGTGALSVTASTKSGVEQLEITAISVAASIAAAFAGQGGYAVAGAGADARNEISGGTLAELSSITGGIAGSATVTAINAAKISATVAAVSGAVAGSGGSGGGALSIGAAFTSNRIGTEGEAFATTA